MLEFLEPQFAIDVNRETIPDTMFTPYLYESQGIEIALSNSEIDTVFWNAAAQGMPTEGIKDFLGYLKNKGIRTGVISNISYASSVVAERINRLLPENLDGKDLE